MLPKNRLRAKRLARLRVFAGDQHPYESNLLTDHAKELFEQALIRERQAEASGTV